MLTEDQILKANELFASAVSYNLAMQSAFVSTDDMVTCSLNVNGMQQTVSIPTWHHILQTVNELANTVKQLQITDDGHDVVQLLSQANNLRFVYLKRQQYYVQQPTGASIVKFDDETVPTEYSASNKLAMFVDLSKCDLPMDAQFAIVQLDGNAAMRLPILYKTTCFDKVATVLSIDNGTMLVDNNTMHVGDIVQVHNSLYNVKYSNENKVELQATGIATTDIIPGDLIYNIVDAVQAYIEVPIVAMHDTMTLQIQYMKLLSAKATYNIQAVMDAGMHATKLTGIKYMVTGKSTIDTMSVLNTSVQALPANLQDIVAASKPKIDKVNITQTNAHQYINSTVESLAKANAALTLARSDIDRYEQLLAQPSLTTDMTLQYKEQLASAQARYNAAQADISELEVSSQDVSPEYEATVYSASVDSNEQPIVQYIARYQRLSYDVKELTNDWQYAYSCKRTIADDGHITSDIDDYSIMNFVRLPIRAYEQLAVQIAAVLCYGQPAMQIMTDWSDVVYTQIPADILKEQSIEDMFKNAYEARIYYNLQQAMQAAGVYSHIDITKPYMHKASDIQFTGDITLLDKLTEMMQSITALKDVANAAQNLTVELVYNGQTYTVANGSTLQITTDKTYCADIFDQLGSDTEAIHEALGSISEHSMLLRIVNNGSQSAMFTTLIAGMPTESLSDSILNYCNIGIQSDSNFVQTYGQAAYAGKTDTAGGVQLVYDRYTPGSDLNDAAFGPEDAPSVPDCQGSIVSSGTLHEYMSLGVHNTGFSMLSHYDAGNANHAGFGVHAGWKYADTEVDSTTSYSNIDSSSDFEDLRNAILAESAKFGRTFMQTKHSQLGLRTWQNIAVGDLSAASVQTQPWFTANDKFTSGICTRGAALFFAPEHASDIKLGATGLTNGIMIEPGTSKALQIPIKFQSRMTDRLGVVDGVDNLTYANDVLVNGDPGSELTYSKAMTIHMNVGNADFKFNLIVSQSYR